ncbi:MAG: YcxB family protein [Candidatus Sulfotelmatobacter sp.]
MEVTFQLTADDFRHGMMAWRTGSRWHRWSYWFGFAVAVPIIIFGVTLLVEYPHSEIKQDSWIMLGGSALWLAFIWALPRLSARMQFRRMPSAQDPMTVAISDSGLRVQSRHGDSQVAWSAYMGWAEEKSVFVLFPQPRIYLPIPKRAFTEQQQAELRETLRRNILPFKSK